MADDPQLGTFVDGAKSLSRNPLGIIALFIVLVYAMASLVVIFGNTGLNDYEKIPLTWFLILFPVLVFGGFMWLVIGYGNRLYGPSDFKDDSDFLQYWQIATLLTAAKAAQGGAAAPAQPVDPATVAKAINFSAPKSVPQPGRGTSVLWVDDHPENNIYVRQALAAAGVTVTTSTTTDDALTKAAAQRFAAIITDLGRAEGPQAGYDFLDRLRAAGNRTPAFIYAASNAPADAIAATQHGAQGNTNDPEQLFRWVMEAVAGRLPSVAQP